MKNRINIMCFLILIFGFFIALCIKKDDPVSREERRYLAERDTLNNYFDGEFSERLETYLLDQFPLRSDFRRLKAFANFSIFGKIENQDIVIQDGYAIKLQPDYNYDGVDETMDRINALINSHFRRNRCYFALVPDKSVFYTEYDNMSCDYGRVEEAIKNKLTDNSSYIEILDTLSLKDYYRTDSHWSQDKLVDTRDALLRGMLLPESNANYESKSIEGFVGVYMSQAALNIKPDKITYLTNSVIDDAIVTDYETGNQIPVYTLEKLEDEKSMDNYDVFLSGPAALLKIDNPSADNHRTLFVFRDSYAGSLVPLLIESYQTIFLVDLRYMDSSLLTEYVSITPNDDVLFIYSTLLISMPNNFKISD